MAEKVQVVCTPLWSLTCSSPIGLCHLVEELGRSRDEVSLHYDETDSDEGSLPDEGTWETDDAALFVRALREAFARSLCVSGIGVSLCPGAGMAGEAWAGTEHNRGCIEIDVGQVAGMVTALLSYRLDLVEKALQAELPDQEDPHAAE